MSTWSKLGAVAAVGVMAFGGASASALAEEPADRDHDLAQLERIQAAQYDAWVREDGAAFAATFTSDADMVTFSGDHLRTRDGIATGMQYYFDNYIDHSAIREVTENVRFAGRDLVVIVRSTCLVNQGETECRADSMSTNTNVLVRKHGRWLQESFQNTRQFALP
jgi:uncharacterized protein (TIGR02246 family)